MFGVRRERKPSELCISDGKRKAVRVLRLRLRTKGGRMRGKLVGPQNPPHCGSPKPATNSKHIRNKPKTLDERLLQDRPDKNYRWSALVWSVLVDRSLEPVDWGVFACFGSREFKTDTLQLGTRWIANVLGVKKDRVQDSIRRLVAAQHVEIVVERRGSRSPVYRLTSPVFAKRQKIIVQDKRGNRITTRDRLRLEQALKGQAS